MRWDRECREGIITMTMARHGSLALISYIQMGGVLVIPFFQLRQYIIINTNISIIVSWKHASGVVSQLDSVDMNLLRGEYASHSELHGTFAMRSQAPPYNLVVDILGMWKEIKLANKAVR
jgi:hypothetical protein